MKILHICNDFCGSKVHSNLYHELDIQGVEQTVYTYFCSRSLSGKNRFDSCSTEFVYRPILHKIHRALYHKKLHDVYGDLKVQLSLSTRFFDLVHATTLFSDGGLALYIFKDYGIPYVVSVRNTDINEFLGYAPHTWRTGVQVLCSARRIIFISKALKEKFCRHPLIRSILPSIEEKFVIQPNGIDSYWLENVRMTPASINHSVLYVGRFDRNKNVIKLCRSILEMRSRFPDIQLHLVGGDGFACKWVKSKACKYPRTIIYHGKICDKATLRDVYSQCSVFAMPSFHETFGLVYIEALSQHLAIVYTKGQGVDGMLDARVGESVKAASMIDIKAAIARIFMHRDNYLSMEVVDFSQFRWEVIASRYVDIYTHCVKGSEAD